MAQSQGQVFHAMAADEYPAEPGFPCAWGSGEDVVTTVDLGAAVAKTTVCFKGVCVGMENGAVALIDTNCDVWELGGVQGPVSVLSTEGNVVVACTSAGEMKMWNLDTLQEVLVFEYPPEVAPSGTQQAAALVTPNGQFIASSSPSAALRLRTLEVRSGEVLSGHSHPVSHLSVTRDSAALVSASDDGVKVWDIASKQCVRSLYPAAVKCLTLTADDTRAVAGTADGAVKVWEIASGREVRTLKRHRDAVNCCAVTPDNTLLVTGSADTQIRTWRLSTLLDEFIFTGHTAPVELLHITPDSRYLLSAAQSVIICDLKDPQQLACLPAAGCLGLTVTPDFTYIVTAGRDGLARFWGRPDSGSHSRHPPSQSLGVISPPFPYVAAPEPVPSAPEPIPSAPESIPPADAPVKYPTLVLEESKQPSVIVMPLTTADNLTESLLGAGSKPQPSKCPWWLVVVVLVVLLLCGYFFLS